MRLGHNSHGKGVLCEYFGASPRESEVGFEGLINIAHTRSKGDESPLALLWQLSPKKLDGIASYYDVSIEDSFDVIALRASVAVGTTVFAGGIWGESIFADYEAFGKISTFNQVFHVAFVKPDRGAGGLIFLPFRPGHPSIIQRL